MAGPSTYPTVFLLGQIALTTSVAAVTMMLLRAGTPGSLVPVTLQTGRILLNYLAERCASSDRGRSTGRSLRKSRTTGRGGRSPARASSRLPERHAAALLTARSHCPTPGGLGDRSCSTSW